MKKRSYSIFVGFTLVTHGLLSIDSRLLDKRYNELSFLATHNGQSHADSAVQNQTLTLSEQLEHGIRATKIHVWYDKNEKGNVIPFVCHGVTKELLDGSYLNKVIDKVPRMFQGWARDALKDMEPINQLIREACKTAYGDGDQEKGIIPFRHCILDPSKRTLQELLGEVKRFLLSHPQEIFTLILEDHTRNHDQIAADFKAQGLDALVYTQDPAKPWSTIGDMIKTNKRLIVFLHDKDEQGSQGSCRWMHPLWNYAWDTAWEFQSPEDLNDVAKDVTPKRGIKAYQERNQGVQNKIFIVHHFVTPLTGGCKKGAHKVNKKAFLKNRIDRLTKETGKKPTLIQIDFFDPSQKDAIEVVNALNEAR